MSENNVVEIENKINTLCDYFNDHPIMFIGVGISVITLAVCKIIDDKINNK